MSVLLGCLAGALALWPVAGARPRLARLSPGRPAHIGLLQGPAASLPGPVPGPRPPAGSRREPDRPRPGSRPELVKAGEDGVLPGGQGVLVRRAGRTGSFQGGRESFNGPVPAGAAAALVAALVSTPLVALLAGAGAGLAARAWSATRQRARERAELQGLAEALGTLAAELRAGRSLDAAVTAVAAACPGEESGARLVRAVRDPGVPAPGGASGALAAAHGRIAAAVLLSGRTGCSLAEVVAAVEDDLRARLRHEQELRAATAGPRAGAGLLAALPVLGLAMGAGVGADPWGVLTTTGVGQVLLVTGVGLEVAGVAWAGRLVRRAVR